MLISGNSENYTKLIPKVFILPHARISSERNEKQKI